MGIHSGKFCLVDGVSTLRSWSIEDITSPAAFVTSNTAGGTGRRPGVRSWSGSYAAFGGLPTHLPNDSFTFTGLTSPESDVEGTIGEVYTGIALVSSVTINWSFSGDDIIIGHTVNFDGHLALSSSQAVVPADATAPDVPTVAPVLMKFGPLGVNTLTCWTTASLEITAALQAYVDSCTVVSNEIWTGQVPGVIDWNSSFVLDETLRVDASIPLIANSYDWEMYVDATDFWDLKTGIVNSFTGITCDRQGAIIQQTVPVSMNANDGTMGSIKVPGETVTNWWPVP